MNTTRMTRITVETETLTIVRRGLLERAWCPACGAETDVIRLTHQSLADSATAPQLRRWADIGKLHLQTGGNLEQVCLPSLLQCLECEEADRLRSWRITEKPIL